MLGQCGDTIVEVVIAIAIASIALMGAYASTNKNSLGTITAQERTQAVKLVETQIEYLRSATTIASTSCFAMDASSGVPGSVVSASPVAPGMNPCIVKGDSMKASATDQPAYTLSLTPDAQGVYEVKAVWDDVSGARSNNVTMFYKPVVLP